MPRDVMPMKRRFPKLGIEIHTMGAGFTWDTQDKSVDIKTSEETWALCLEKMRSDEYENGGWDSATARPAHTAQNEKNQRVPRPAASRSGATRT